MKAARDFYVSRLMRYLEGDDTLLDRALYPDDGSDLRNIPAATLLLRLEKKVPGQEIADQKICAAKTHAPSSHETKITVEDSNGSDIKGSLRPLTIIEVTKKGFFLSLPYHLRAFLPMKYFRSSTDDKQLIALIIRHCTAHRGVFPFPIVPVSLNFDTNAVLVSALYEHVSSAFNAERPSNYFIKMVFPEKVFEKKPIDTSVQSLVNYLWNRQNLVTCSKHSPPPHSSQDTSGTGHCGASSPSPLVEVNQLIGRVVPMRVLSFSSDHVSLGLPGGAKGVFLQTNKEKVSLANERLSPDRSSLEFRVGSVLPGCMIDFDISNQLVDVTLDPCLVGNGAKSKALFSSFNQRVEDMVAYEDPGGLHHRVLFQATVLLIKATYCIVSIEIPLFPHMTTQTSFSNSLGPTSCDASHECLKDEKSVQDLETEKGKNSIIAYLPRSVMDYRAETQNEAAMDLSQSRKMIFCPGERLVVKLVHLWSPLLPYYVVSVAKRYSRSRPESSGKIGEGFIFAQMEYTPLVDLDDILEEPFLSDLNHPIFSSREAARPTSAVSKKTSAKDERIVPRGQFFSSASLPRDPTPERELFYHDEKSRDYLTLKEIQATKHKSKFLSENTINFDEKSEPSKVLKRRKKTNVSKEKTRAQYIDIVEREKVFVSKTSPFPHSSLTSVDDFERCLVIEPQKSLLWIQYLRFELARGQVESARQIAERALQTIHYRENEKLQRIWVEYLSLEHTNGTEESLDQLFRRALSYSDAPLRLHFALLRIYETTRHKSRAFSFARRMLVKFKDIPEVWIRYGRLCASQKRIENIQAMLKEIVFALPQKKDVSFVILQVSLALYDLGNVFFLGECEDYFL